MTRNPFGSLPAGSNLFLTVLRLTARFLAFGTGFPHQQTAAAELPAALAGVAMAAGILSVVERPRPVQRHCASAGELTHLRHRRQRGVPGDSTQRQRGAWYGSGLTLSNCAMARSAARCQFLDLPKTSPLRQTFRLAFLPPHAAVPRPARSRSTKMKS